MSPLYCARGSTSAPFTTPPAPLHTFHHHRDDLVTFFSDTWATALYAESFPEFADSLRATLADDPAIADVFEKLSAMLLPTDDPEIVKVLDTARDETIAREIGPTGKALPRNTQDAVSRLVRGYLRDLASVRVVDVYECS